jgi:hypothetical protein
VGRRLLAASRERCAPNALRLLNVDRGRPELHGFLDRLGFMRIVSRREMMLAL